MLAAADRGLINIVKESIQKKANVNYQDKDVSYYLIIINYCLLVIDSFVAINLMITSLWIQYTVYVVYFVGISFRNFTQNSYSRKKLFANLRWIYFCG